MSKREYPMLKLAESVDIGCRQFPIDRLPNGIRLDACLGIAGASGLHGFWAPMRRTGRFILYIQSSIFCARKIRENRGSFFPKKDRAAGVSKSLTAWRRAGY